MGHDRLLAILTAHSFQRVPYEGDEEEATFMSGRERLYDGQAHTDNGVRGRTEVCGVTFRDIADAITTELHRSRARDPDGRWDDDALAMNVSVLIEKMMGIYPNIASIK
jgi:hypothetical protein